MKRKAAALQKGDFLEDVAASLARRAKAIKYSASLKTTRGQDPEDGSGNPRDRLEIDISYRMDASRVLLRTVIWKDRWVWIHARRVPKRGLLWEATLQGRFVSADGSRDLVDKIEQTLVAAYQVEDEDTSSIRSIWESNLAQGPKRV